METQGAPDSLILGPELHVSDPEKLQKRIIDLRIYADNAVNSLAATLNGQQMPRALKISTDHPYVQAIQDCMQKIAAAKELGIDVREIEENFESLFA